MYNALKAGGSGGGGSGGGGGGPFGGGDSIAALAAAKRGALKSAPGKRTKSGRISKEEAEQKRSDVQNLINLKSTSLAVPGAQSPSSPKDSDSGKLSSYLSRAIHIMGGNDRNAVIYRKNFPHTHFGVYINNLYNQEWPISVQD